MYRLMSTPQVGIIHQVVMQQGIVMIGLQTTGRHEDILRLVFKKVVRHQHQYRAYALATDGEHITDRVIQRLGFPLVRELV